MTTLTTLEGLFTCAVWDDRTGDFWAIAARYGPYPHYYAQVGGKFALAPEIKAMLAAPGIARTLDLVAVAKYAHFQQLLGERHGEFPPASM